MNPGRVGVQLARFRHKGLRQLHEDGSTKGLPPSMADKLSKLLPLSRMSVKRFALETADDLAQVGRFPGWKLHPLRGEMKDCGVLTVTEDWRFDYH
jgi:toxin HigB-1